LWRFRLELHETDERTGVRENAWITIDPQRDVIEQRTVTPQRPVSLDQKMQVMKEVGFDRVEIRTMEGQLFVGGPEPGWLWIVGRR